MCPYTSCNDCCIVHSNGARVDPELVGGFMAGAACCCCISLQLVLILVLTFAPCTLTVDTNTPLTHCGFTYCSLCWQCCFFIQPLVQILHFKTWWYHALQLALLVFSLPTTGTNTALALEQLGLCGGDLCTRWLKCIVKMVVVAMRWWWFDGWRLPN